MLASSSSLRRVSFAASAAVASGEGQGVEKARAELEEQDTPSVTETSALEGEDEKEDVFIPLKEGRRESTATAASSTQRSTATLGGSESWDEDASELSWEFTIDSSSSLRQSKTKTAGQRRKSSLSQNKRMSELTIDKLQFARLGNLYGRDRECRQLQEAWDELRNQGRDVQSSKDFFGESEPASSSSTKTNPAARAKTPARNVVRRVIEVHGSSGTGKSTLVETLRGPVTREGGFFLSGKFPQQMRLSRHAVVPYSALVAACNDLVDLLLSLDDNADLQRDSVPENNTQASWSEGLRSLMSHRRNCKFTLQSLRQRLRRDLDPLSARVLVRIVPSLCQVISTEESDPGDVLADFRQGQEQLRFAFRRFFRALGAIGPVVLAIDDLQWADASSMDLLEALAVDRENASLMVIGCYRDDDVYLKCPHVKSLETIRAVSKDDPNLYFISIPIGNLEVGQVNEFLVDLLSSNESATADLAAIVHRKTLGNVFFVIQFLTLLQESDILVFNIGAMKWVYDVGEIQQATAATENVVSLMKRKMRSLPESIGHVLPIMACLGSTFHVSLLSLVVENFEFSVGTSVVNTASVSTEGKDSMEASPLLTANQLLAACVEEGLIEPGPADGGVETYQWIHDKIQETAISLVSDEELKSLKLRMGKVLFEQLNPSDLDQYLFTVVDLLNTESSDPSSLPLQEPIEVAKLFLRAGTRTIENSAFDRAVEYLATGIELLPSRHWETDYELSLDLFSTAAQANFCSGNFDRMQSYCDAVINQANRPLIDKRRVYNAIIDAKCCECSILALDMCRDILVKVGIRFPRFGILFHVIGGVVNVKSTLKKTPDLPSLMSSASPMQDDMKLWIMALLDKFTTYAYLAKSALLPLAIFKGFRMTLKDGVSYLSPVMFSLVGLSLVAAVQDYKGGVDFAEEALAMLKRVKGSRQVEARVLMVAHTFVFHWMKPIQLSVKPSLTSYELGRTIGDTESACWSIITYVEFSLRSGSTLEIILADCAFYGEEMREVKQRNALDTFSQMWQAVLHLSGSNPFNGTLSGEVANPDITLRHEHFFATHYRWLMYVAFVLGYYDLVYNTIMKTKQHKGFYEELLPGTLGICHLYAFNGLALISLFRDSKKRKFLRLAKKFAAKIKGFAVAGNPNVTHFDSLLTAEFFSLRGESEAAGKQYEAAILYSGRRGIIQDRALAHERYGEHFERLGVEHEQDAAFHFREAYKLYEDWGAHAKVQLMKKLHLKHFKQ